MTFGAMGMSRNLLIILAFFILQVLNGHNILAIGEDCHLSASNERGRCVDVKQCTEYQRILITQGQEAAKILQDSCNPSSQPIVCCPTNEPQLETINSQSQSKSPNKPLNYPDCGKSKGEFSIIQSGGDAKLGNWPWIARLGYFNNTTGKLKWRCAGSLISNKHILTAAHCAWERSDLKLARLGELDLSSDDDGASPINIEISRVIIHPEYNPSNQENDIAILRLKDEVQFTDLIHPICLPVTPNLKNENLESKFSFIAGWGPNLYRGPSASTLQEAQIMIDSESNCNNTYSKLPEQALGGRIVDHRVLCAGDIEKKGHACQGENGGSLMFPFLNAFYAVGVVSFNYRCADEGFPGVYTKVSHYLDFITKNL